MTSISSCSEVIAAFSAAWAAKDIDAVMALMADDCEFRASVGPGPGTVFAGRDEVRRGVALFLTPNGGPDPETLSETLLAGDGFAVTRWTLRLPGDAGLVHGCDVFEIDDEGRILVKDTYRKVAGSLEPAGD